MALIGRRGFNEPEIDELSCVPVALRGWSHRAQRSALLQAALVGAVLPGAEIVLAPRDLDPDLVGEFGQVLEVQQGPGDVGERAVYLGVSLGVGGQRTRGDTPPVIIASRRGGGA